MIKLRSITPSDREIIGRRKKDTFQLNKKNAQRPQCLKHLGS